MSVMHSFCSLLHARHIIRIYHLQQLSLYKTKKNHLGYHRFRSVSLLEASRSSTWWGVLMYVIEVGVVLSTNFAVFCLK